MDVWNINDWFIRITPKMLKEFKKGLHGHPGQLDADGKDGMKEWKKIINRMIFLLHEMDENKCSQKNEFEEEWWNNYQKFEKDFGIFGKKLLTEEEKENAKKTGATRIHFPQELPEYKDVTENFLKREEELALYRDKCKDEFFDLFKKYFWDLWD